MPSALTASHNAPWYRDQLLWGVALVATLVLLLTVFRGGSPEVGRPMAEFASAGWLNDGPNTLPALRGKVAVVCAFTTRCPHCGTEADKLAVMYQKYHSQGVEFVSLTPETEGPRVQIKRFAEAHSMTWPIGYGGVTFFELMNVDTVPRVWVIDGEGKIAWEHSMSGTLEDAIQEALSNSRPASAQRSSQPDRRSARFTSPPGLPFSSPALGAAR